MVFAIGISNTTINHIAMCTTIWIQITVIHSTTISIVTTMIRFTTERNRFSMTSIKKNNKTIPSSIQKGRRQRFVFFIFLYFFFPSLLIRFHSATHIYSANTAVLAFRILHTTVWKFRIQALISNALIHCTRIVIFTISWRAATELIGYRNVYANILIHITRVFRTRIAIETMLWSCTTQRNGFMPTSTIWKKGKGRFVSLINQVFDFPL